nr:MAG TPA: hypothetical protein [Inoviridae sp.]
MLLPYPLNIMYINKFFPLWGDLGGNVSNKVVN